MEAMEAGSVWYGKSKVDGEKGQPMNTINLFWALTKQVEAQICSQCDRVVFMFESMHEIIIPLLESLQQAFLMIALLTAFVGIARCEFNTHLS